jgi:hypothetical protein
MTVHTARANENAAQSKTAVPPSSMKCDQETTYRRASARHNTTETIMTKQKEINHVMCKQVMRDLRNKAFRVAYNAGSRGVRKHDLHNHNVAFDNILARITETTGYVAVVDTDFDVSAEAVSIAKGNVIAGGRKNSTKPPRSKAVAHIPPNTLDGRHGQ